METNCPRGERCQVKGCGHHTKGSGRFERNDSSSSAVVGSVERLLNEKDFLFPSGEYKDSEIKHGYLGELIEPVCKHSVLHTVMNPGHLGLIYGFATFEGIKHLELPKIDPSIVTYCADCGEKLKEVTIKR